MLLLTYRPRCAFWHPYLGECVFSIDGEHISLQYVEQKVPVMSIIKCPGAVRLAVTSDGSLLAALDLEGVVSVWTLLSRPIIARRISTWLLTRCVQQLEFCPEGRCLTLYLGGYTKFCRIDVKTGEVFS